MIWRLLLLVCTFFAFVGQVQSITCDQSCATCALPSDSSACTSCSTSGYYLLLVNDDYGPCVSSTQCTTYSGLTLSTGTVNKCFIGGRCPPGYFTSGTACQACNSTCKECSGVSGTQCLSCPSGSMLNLTNDEGGSCVVIGSATCSNTTYSSGLLCAKNGTSCASTCATCYGNSIYQCKTCPSSSMIMTENYIDSNERWGQCGTTVTLSRRNFVFGFNPQNYSQQFKCHWTCRACISENDRFACTACSDNAYLHIVTETAGAAVGVCRPACSSTGERSLAVGSRKYCSASGTFALPIRHRRVSLQLDHQYNIQLYRGLPAKLDLRLNMCDLQPGI